MKRLTNHVMRLAVCACLLLCQVAAWAQSADSETPIITFKTSIYETYGETNAFHFVIGAKQDTYIDVDCGYGTMEYEVSQAVFNSETGAIEGTTISCKVSPEGVVKIYGDASLIDYFDAEGCYIRNLDISALTELEILSLSHNELEALNLDNNNKLQALTLNDNPFSVTPLKVGKNKPDLVIIDLDLIGNIDPSFNISDYPGLITFQAWNTMSLKWIDPTGCPELVRLSIDATSVASLDVSKNPKLRILNISDTRIPSVDLSNNPALTEFYCTHQSGSLNTDIKLTSLDLTKNPELYYLACSGNLLKSIDLSKNPKLFDLSIRENLLTSIDLSHNTNLYNVKLTNNYMDFATLPIDPGTWAEYEYEQHDMPTEPAYPVGTVLDFSSRVLRNGTETYAELYCYNEADPNNSRPLDASYYEYANGKVTLLKAYPTDSLYIAFGNSAFPNTTMNTTKFMVKTASEYGKPSKMVSLGTYAADGTDLSLSVGIHGATPETPKEFYVDFGDGNLQTFTATTDTIPVTANVNGKKKSYGNVSILVPDGTMLSALESRLQIYDIDVTAARSLLYLSLPGAGLYSIDLQWNRLLKTLNLSGNNLTTLSLSGKNSLYNKNMLADINVSHNRLTAIEMPDNRVMHRLDISNNLFEELSLKDASNLEELNISHNSIAEINLAYCTPLTTADLSYNRLTSVVFPEEGNNLRRLAINNNNFTFANMPQFLGMGIEECIYAPQEAIVIPTKGPGINLNDQLITVDGQTTQFVWKDETGRVMTPGTDYDIVGGKTTFRNIDMGRIRCEMTNGAYPDLTGDNALTTTYILAAGMPTHVLASFTTPVGGESVALSFRAAAGSPAIYIDWSGDKDLAQYPLNSYTYTRFSATTTKGADVKVYTYGEDETLSVFSMTGATMTNLDASPMKDLTTFTVDNAGLTDFVMPESPALRELSLSGNALATIDLARFPELSSLALNNNKLSQIDLSANPKLAMLNLANNEFTTLALNNSQLWHLDVTANKLTDISFAGLPAIEQLALGSNELTSIDVDNLTNLKVMFLYHNKFSFAGLPQVKSQYVLYTYSDQAVVEAEEIDGKIDLSAHRSAYGTDTKYTWYLDMPAFNEYGELEGEELYADDEYVITDGVTTFLKPFNNVVCVMTNEQFPKLYIYTPMMNVKGTTAINAATASDRNITISMDGSTITVKAPAETTATLYAVDGRTARRTTLSSGESRFDNIQPGVYVLKIGKKAYKLNVK